MLANSKTLVLISVLRRTKQSNKALQMSNPLPWGENTITLIGTEAVSQTAVTPMCKASAPSKEAKCKA